MGASRMTKSNLLSVNLKYFKNISSTQPLHPTLSPFFLHTPPTHSLSHSQPLSLSLSLPHRFPLSHPLSLTPTLLSLQTSIPIPSRTPGMAKISGWKIIASVCKRNTDERAPRPATRTWTEHTILILILVLILSMMLLMLLLIMINIRSLLLMIPPHRHLQGPDGRSVLACYYTHTNLGDRTRSYSS